MMWTSASDEVTKSMRDHMNIDEYEICDINILNVYEKIRMFPAESNGQ